MSDDSYQINMMQLALLQNMRGLLQGTKDDPESLHKIFTPVNGEPGMTGEFTFTAELPDHVCNEDQKELIFNKGTVHYFLIEKAPSPSSHPRCTLGVNLYIGPLHKRSLDRINKQWPGLVTDIFKDIVNRTGLKVDSRIEPEAGYVSTPGVKLAEAGDGPLYIWMRFNHADKAKIVTALDNLIQNFQALHPGVGKRQEFGSSR